MQAGARGSASGRDVRTMSTRPPAAAIEDAGFGEYFVHRTGHGLGISTHEPPWIMRGRGRAQLRAGMVHSIEPGIYLPGEFGVRLEEIVHVTDDGVRALQPSSARPPRRPTHDDLTEPTTREEEEPR